MGHTLVMFIKGDIMNIHIIDWYLISDTHFFIFFFFYFHYHHPISWIRECDDKIMMFTFILFLVRFHIITHNMWSIPYELLCKINLHISSIIFDKNGWLIILYWNIETWEYPSTDKAKKYKRKGSHSYTPKYY